MSELLYCVVWNSPLDGVEVSTEPFSREFAEIVAEEIERDLLGASCRVVVYVEPAWADPHLWCWPPPTVQ